AVASDQERALAPKGGAGVRRLGRERQRGCAEVRAGGRGRRAARLDDDGDAPDGGGARGIERDQQATVGGRCRVVREHHRRRHAGGDQKLGPLSGAGAVLDGGVAVGGGGSLRQRRFPSASRLVEALFGGRTAQQREPLITR